MKIDIITKLPLVLELIGISVNGNSDNTNPLALSKKHESNRNSATPLPKILNFPLEKKNKAYIINDNASSVTS